MPLARLIFFPEPRELTEEQIEEARALGHLAEEPDGGAAPQPDPPADSDGTPGAEPGDDNGNEAGDAGHDPEETA